MLLDDETIKKIRRLIIFTVIVVLLGANWRSVLSLLLYLTGLFRPFIMGACMAFVLNVLMRSIEKRLSGIKKPHIRRGLSLGGAFLLLLVILFLVVMVVVPQLAASLISLSNRIPAFVQNSLELLETYLEDNPELLTYVGSIAPDWNAVYEQAKGFLSLGLESLLSGSFLAVRSIAGAVANFGIGLFFAIYLLLGKETLKSQAARTIRALVPRRHAERIFHVAELSERKFSGFITGQCLEACILGLMFFLTLTILRLPYALLVGVLIAFTALIPVFGAFIGFFVCAFLMLVQSPADVIIFAVLFLVLQQIEGNLIYPHVVGGSVDLPAVWVLMAVTVGGSMFGVFGMIFFIPLFSVLYALLRERVHRSLSEQQRRSGPKEGVLHKSDKKQENLRKNPLK